jgi:hypothetical protein
MPEEIADEPGSNPAPLTIEALEEEARLEYFAGRTEAMGFYADVVVVRGPR